MIKREYKNSENPQLVICTPLRKGDVIHEDCRKSIVNQLGVPMVWYSFESDGNASENRMDCFNSIENINDAKFIIFCDYDIIWTNQYVFMKQINDLLMSPVHVGYSYGSFKYVKHDNYAETIHSFPAQPWDLERLVGGNYISTMSMMKMEVFKDSGGFDTSLERFQDWDLWLKLASKGYMGIPHNPTLLSFITPLNTDHSISGKPNSAKDMLFVEKYRRNPQRVFQKIIKVLNIRRK